MLGEEAEKIPYPRRQQNGYRHKLNIKLITEPAFLPNTCYKKLRVLKLKLIMETTPKEKAIEIFNKCCDYADYTDEDCCFTERETMYKNAKALSFIMVNEILKDRERLSDAFFYDLNYWIDVKKEIECIEICENDVLKFPKKYTEKHLKEHALKFACFLEKWQGGSPNIKVLENEVYKSFISTENQT